MPDPSFLDDDAAGRGTGYGASWSRETRRRNGVALALTIALHLLVLLAVLFVRGPQFVRMQEHGLTGFLIPAPPSPDKEKSEKKQEKKAEKSKAEEAAAAPPAAKPPPVPSAARVPQQPAFIEMDLAGTDISKLGKAPSASASKGDSKAVYGPGQGPGGVTLYEAEWYRKPTDAELAGYLPANRPRRGWGLVACRTIEDYHVDNCQSLGESPMGSGFARAVRQAAWQFRVMPPRVDGKPQIGTWVRIRISYGMEGDPEG